MQDRCKGFTLVEMVIAITIFGITMALAYAALHVANQSMQKVSQVQSDVEQLRTSYYFLRQHLSRAGNHYVQGERFKGDENKLTFIAAVPMRALGGGRPYSFQLFEKNKDELKRQLVLTYQPADPENQEGKTTRVLAEYTGNIKFSYLADLPDPAGLNRVEEGWVDTWTGYGLPYLFKLKLVDNESGNWPEQVVELRYAGIQIE